MSNPLPKKRRTFSERLYALLLAAYPPEFRREYGREMSLVFADRCREGARRGRDARASVLARVWRDALFDLMRTAPKERLESFLEGDGVMRVLRTVALAVVAYAFTLAVIAPWFVRNHAHMPSFVGNVLDALMATGVLFNVIYLVLTLTRWREGARAVRLTLVLTTLVLAALFTVMIASGGPPARPHPSVFIAQVLGLLIWFSVHLWWVLRKRRQPEPPAAV